MANTKKKTDAAASDSNAVMSENSTPLPKEEKIVSKEVDLSQFITVRNGFHGRLVYKSRRTGEKYVWDGFGSEQEMELRELRNAKNSSKAFFSNNWFMFDDDWVLDYLGVRSLYKHALNVEDFDSIFKQTPAELKKLISELPDSQKRSVAYRAMQLIADGTIDSRKKIAALEEALGRDLTEK